MQRMEAVLDKLEEYICFFALSVMTVAILLQILNRSFLGRPFPWGEELARYMMIWATAAGISAGVKIGAHVGVDALVGLLPARAQALFVIGVGFGALAFFALVSYLSLELVWGIRETRQTSPAMQMPMWLAYLAFPVGFILCCVRQIQLIIGRIAGLKRRPAPDGGRP